MDDFETDLLRQSGPVLAGPWEPAAETRFPGEVDQRLFDEMRDEARVSPVGNDRGRTAGVVPAKSERALPQCVVRARCRWQARIGVAARPRLDAGVEIERALFLAQL